MTDTGPAYPPGPSAGSNAVGSFAVGMSQVGAIRAFDIEQTIISQYANSPILTGIIGSFQDAADQTNNVEAFYDNIINVLTAVGYGLDVWGRIVAVNRVLKIGVGPRYFGFDEGGVLDYDLFGPGGASPFYSGQKLTDNYILSDDGFRVLILAKAFSNICGGSSSDINRLLRTLFGFSGKAYVVDNLDMTMTYKFLFTPTAVQFAILTQSGVFPKPTGVSYDVDVP